MVVLSAAVCMSLTACNAPTEGGATDNANSVDAYAKVNGMSGQQRTDFLKE